MAKAVHFFLGANSGVGFQNLFERFCRTEKHDDLLILKGGPGCGKSTMMRKIGEAMESRGEDVEYLHCSGDPDSLDGVRIPRIRTAVVDGTAPHSIDAKYPAAVDRYVDLGQFYSIYEAKKARDKIVFATESCSEAYRGAYQVLGAAAKLEENMRGMLLGKLDLDRLLRRADGIISRELRGEGRGGERRYRFLESLTCKGKIRYFDSVGVLSCRIYALMDRYGIAPIMLDRISKAAASRNFGMILCPDPENTNRLLHLIIPELELSFVSVGEGDALPFDTYRKIHLDEFISSEERKSQRGKIKLMEKMIKTIREEGIDRLHQAKAAHDALEKLYLSGVDFAGIDELVGREIERIQQYL